jgi:hypothetical protein
MKRIFIFSLLSVALLTSCKFRTPKSEQEAINNRIVENGEMITVRMPAVIINLMGIDKDLDGMDSIAKTHMILKYSELYKPVVNGKFEIISTRATDLRLADEILEKKLPGINIGNRKARMVLFLPGLDPIIYDKMPDAQVLASDIAVLEKYKQLTPEERVEMEELRKKDELKKKEALPEMQDNTKMLEEKR